MSAALYRFRSEVRRGGWRFLVGVTLLFGLVGGCVLLAFAGARRTASAYERLEHDTHATHLLVNPNDEETAKTVTADVLRSLDGVEDVVTATGIVALFDGKVTEAAVFQTEPGSSWLDDADRPIVREGRLPDQSRPDELFANPAGARSIGMDVGDTVDLVIVSWDELGEPAPGDTRSPEQQVEQLAADGEIGFHMTATLVGIGVTVADVVPEAELDAVYLTKAFVEEHTVVPAYGGNAVRLTDGVAGIDPFIGALRAKLPPGGIIDFQTLSSDIDTVHRAVTPQVIALGVLASVLALGLCLAVAQTLARRTALLADEDEALDALGMTRIGRSASGWLRVLCIASGGALVAIVTGWLLSPLTPIGVARDAEPSRGFAFDAVALLAGAVGIGGLLVALYGGLSLASRAERQPTPSRVVTWLRTRSTSPPLAVGVGLALEPGRGRTAVPIRSSLVTAVVGMAAVIASLTFTSSLDRLTASPRDTGSDFDAFLETGDLDDGQEDWAFSSVATVLDESEGVTSWSELYAEQITLPSGVVPVNGLRVDKGNDASPTLVSGRLPVDADEIALGASTMRREGVAIGDRIDVRRGANDDPRPFEVVGQVVLPGIRNYDASDQAALGIGALVALDGLVVLSGAEVGDGPRAADIGYPAGLLVTFAPGSGADDLTKVLDAELGPNTFIVGDPPTSSDVGSLGRVRSTPLLLASLLGVVAAVAVGHALVLSVRRRRRDLALLRTLGFTPGQVTRTIVWQSMTMAAISCGVGIPLGVVVGRLGWGALTEQLGIVDHPATPWIAILVAVPVAVVFANAVAFLPGRRAARISAADALRTA